MIHSIPDWWVIVVYACGESIVPVLVTICLWRNRERFPQAARLLFLAVLCEVVQWLYFILLRTRVLPYGASGKFSGSLTNISDPQVQHLIVMQLIWSSFEIASWLLIAWAVLMRPDERRSRTA